MLDLRFCGERFELNAAGTGVWGSTAAGSTGVLLMFLDPTFVKRFDLLRLGNSRSLPHPFRMSIHVPG
jgi:hypothetical protein